MTNVDLLRRYIGDKLWHEGVLNDLGSHTNWYWDFEDRGLMKELWFWADTGNGNIGTLFTIKVKDNAKHLIREEFHYTADRAEFGLGDPDFDAKMREASAEFMKVLGVGGD